MSKSLDTPPSCPHAVIVDDEAFFQHWKDIVDDRTVLFPTTGFSISLDAHPEGETQSCVAVVHACPLAERILKEAYEEGAWVGWLKSSDFEKLWMFVGRPKEILLFDISVMPKDEMITFFLSLAETEKIFFLKVDKLEVSTKEVIVMNGEVELSLDDRLLYDLRRFADNLMGIVGGRA